MATAFASELTALVSCGRTVKILECDRDVDRKIGAILVSVLPIFSLRKIHALDQYTFNLALSLSCF